MASRHETDGFLRNAFDAFVRARQRQAQIYVDDVLRSLDRGTLADQFHGSARAKKRPD